MFLSGGKEEAVEEIVEEKPLTPENITYIDFPELLINLKGKGKRQKFMKAVVILELAKPEDQSIMEPLIPRIMDSFQVYLRELRLEDVEGSGGMDPLARRITHKAE